MSHCMRNQQFVIIFFRSDGQDDRIAILNEGDYNVLPYVVMERGDNQILMENRAIARLNTDTLLTRNRLPIFVGANCVENGIALVSLFQVERMPEGVTFVSIRQLPSSLHFDHKQIIDQTIMSGWLRADSVYFKNERRMEA